MKTGTFGFIGLALTMALLVGCDSMQEVNAENCENTYKLKISAGCDKRAGVNTVECQNIRKFRAKCRVSEDIGMSPLVRGQLFSEPQWW